MLHLEPLFLDVFLHLLDFLPVLVHFVVPLAPQLLLDDMNLDCAHRIHEALLLMQPEHCREGARKLLQRQALIGFTTECGAAQAEGLEATLNQITVSLFAL